MLQHTRETFRPPVGRLLSGRRTHKWAGLMEMAGILWLSVLAVAAQPAKIIGKAAIPPAILRFLICPVVMTTRITFRTLIGRSLRVCLPVPITSRGRILLRL